jgi:hypothetical protein
MRWALRIAVMLVAVSGMTVESPAQPNQTAEPEPSLTVTGKLVRVMAIGAESTGWSVELVSPIKVENKELNSIQVRYRSGSKLEKLADKRVKASGKITVQHGRETGAYPVLEISSIKEVKTTVARTSGQDKTQ